MRDLPPEPEYVRRFYRRWVPGALAVNFGLALLVAGPWNWTRALRALTAGLGLAWDTMLWLVLITLPAVAWLTIVVAWERRLVRRAHVAEYRLCPRCAYSLVVRRGTITCPECGGPCEMDEVESMWRAFRPRITRAGIRG